MAKNDLGFYNVSFLKVLFGRLGENLNLKPQFYSEGFSHHLPIFLCHVLFFLTIHISNDCCFF